MNALTFNNVVVQVSENTFEVAPGLVWHVCGEDVQPGWIKDENNIFAPFQIILNWDQIRSQRNGLLVETDWVAIKHQEQGSAIPAEWSNYRQALRDITSNFSTPDSVVWPVKPS